MSRFYKLQPLLEKTVKIALRPSLITMVSMHRFYKLQFSLRRDCYGGDLTTIRPNLITYHQYVSSQNYRLIPISQVQLAFRNVLIVVIHLVQNASPP